MAENKNEVAKMSHEASAQDETLTQDKLVEQGKPAAQGEAADARLAETAKRDEEKVTRLGSASIPKLIVEFAVPSIIGIFVNAAYNLIDALFLGQVVGEIGLATTQVAMPTMSVFIALAAMIGVGGNALASLKLGEKRRDLAEKVLGNTFSLCFVLWFVVIICASVPPVFEALLTISSATDDVRESASVFLRILSYGYIFQCVSFGINNFIRTAGAPNRALLTMVVGAVACIIFNFIFVVIMGMGVPGSALATICGEACSFVSVLWYFIVTKGVPLKLRVKYMRIEWKLCAKICALGISSFVMQIGNAIVTFVLNYLLVKYGALHPIGAENALASIGLVMRVTMLVITPLIGLSIAIQPILGFNYGAGLFKRVRTTWVDGMIGGVALGLVMMLITVIFAEPIVNLFGITDESLMHFTAVALRIQVCMFPIVGFQMVGSNYFQATGQPLKSALLSLTRQILFLLPLLFILPELLPHMIASLTSLDAIYIATPASDLLAAAVTLIFVFVEFKHLRTKAQAQRTGARAEAGVPGAA